MEKQIVNRTKPTTSKLMARVKGVPTTKAGEMRKEHKRIVNTEVDLSNHSFRAIPPYIYDHPRLHTLIVSNNLISEIPRAIGSLRQLRKLNADDNRLTFIADNICNCNKLQTLSLCHNNLCSLPAKIDDLQSLRYLNLAHNEFENIPHEIGLLHKLIELNLQNNQLWFLPVSIESLRSLKKLNISCNNFEHVPIPICHLHSLQTLSLNNNQLHSLSPAFQNLENLHELNISDNLLRNIPPPIFKLHQLRYLNIGQNQISEIPNEISVLTRMKVLHIAGNLLTEIPRVHLNLRYINLSQNRLVNFSVANMRKLKYLNADNNELENTPTGLFNLKNLEHLKLNGNHLTLISQDIALLKHLRSLDLGNNHLTSLPHVINELPHLNYFNVNGNEIKKRFTAEKVSKQSSDGEKSWLLKKLPNQRTDKPLDGLVSKMLKHFSEHEKQKNLQTHVQNHMMRSTPKHNNNKLHQENSRDQNPLHRKKMQNTDSSDIEIHNKKRSQSENGLFSKLETLPKSFRHKNIVRSTDGRWHISDSDCQSTLTYDSSSLSSCQDYPQHNLKYSRQDLNEIHAWNSGGSKQLLDNINLKWGKYSNIRKSHSDESGLATNSAAIFMDTEYFILSKFETTFVSKADPLVRLIIPANSVRSTQRISMQVIKIFPEAMVAAYEELPSVQNILSVSDILIFNSKMTLNNPVFVMIPLPYRTRHSYVHILTITEEGECVPFTGSYSETGGHLKLSIWSFSGKVAVACKSRSPYDACHSVEQLLCYILS